MAIKQIPVIDAAEATQQVNYIAEGATVTPAAQDPRDLRGLASARPAANSVSAGVTYWAVDTGVVSVSDGTNWREV